MARLLHADLIAQNVRAELWLNDIPLGIAGGHIPYVSAAASMFVIDGENLLETIVNPGPEPALARGHKGTSTAENVSVRARLAALEPGQFTDDPNAPVLIKADWEGRSAGDASVVVAAKANLGPMLGPWDWQSAPILKLDAATVAHVTRVLELIRTSLNHGDASVLGRLAQPKFEAAARAFPARSLADTVKQFTAAVERNATTPGWSMAPFELGAFSFRLVAGGRLIDCINKDWKATLRSVPPEGRIPMYFPMFLGMSRGALVVFL